jgi:signal transduction histidine kinase
MAVPIVIDGAVWGALNVGFSGARQANLDRVEFMKVMGSHLAAGVHNAELHARLRAAYEDLQRTQEQVIQQERLRALGQMASGIAHDFNNALAPIIGFGELLLDEPAARGDARRVNEYLEIMVSSAQDAAAVVARLRDFYRPREGQMLAAIDVAEIVEQAVLLTRPRWEAQTQAEGAAVRVKTTLRSVPMIAGDPVELREALTNLIFNAVDALPEGGEILIEACPQGDEVVCRVADNGVGMTEEVRQRCLEPFFTTKGDKGSGLGLAMVYGIAQRWGARIEIDSAVGRGTTITLYLPVRLVGDTAREPPPESAAGAYSVLIADDDARVLDFVAEVLRRVGHQVVACHNGREAYQSFCEGQFDVVVTDRGMPEINGDQLAAMIKRRSPRTPVVLFTGFGDLLGDERDRPPGVDAVLPKPVRVALLREVVAELGARSRGGGVGSA